MSSASVGRIVTVDITRHNEAALALVPTVVRVQGHSLAPATIQAICSGFEKNGPGSIDLLFVDSRHEYRHTLENIAVYANRLKPKVIVVDDINLTEGMRKLWREIVRLDAGESVDVSHLVDRIDAGFGVIECRYPFRWPELGRVRREALRTFERGHDL